MARHGARRALAACVLGALQGALVEARMPSGPFVTSINGLGVPVNDWPTSDESVSAMMYHSLADVDPLVRLAPCPVAACTGLQRAQGLRRARPLGCCWELTRCVAVCAPVLASTRRRYATTVRVHSGGAPYRFRSGTGRGALD